MLGRIAAIIIATCFVGLAGSAKADPVVAPACGEFTPLVEKVNPASSYVHFFPKVCNLIMIDGKLETIPAGTGVMTGGVQAGSDDACIDKVCGQTLQPATTYYTYVWCADPALACNMKLNFSTVGHKEDPTHGNEVHATDPTQSLVGMTRLMKDNLISAHPWQQPTISWFNRGHTAMAKHFGSGQPRPYSCSNTVAPAQAIDAFGNVIPGYEFSMEWLSFGINNQFLQAFTVPNIHVFGTMTSDTAGGQGYVFLGNRHGNTISAPAYYQHSTTNPAGQIFTVVAGAEPENEGYGKVVLLMSNGGTGGCVTLQFGTMFSSPLES